MKKNNQAKNGGKSSFCGILIWVVAGICLVALVSWFVIHFSKGADPDVAQAQTEAQSEANADSSVADNSTYAGQIHNLTRAYETGEAKYQMATFAPQYKEYVMETYGYANEEAMANALTAILAETKSSYEATFGVGYVLVESIVSETDLDEAQITALKEEMKALYLRDFPITAAKEVKIEVLASPNSSASNDDTVVASSAAAKSEDTCVVAKLENDGWYILK